MTARLTSSVFVSGLLRLAEHEGGFGAVVTKGDATAGAVLVLLAERGQPAMLLERLLQPDGNYRWDSALAAADDAGEVGRFLGRRRKFDPDCWVVELDIPSAERFAAEIRALD
jgi:hypothetical protein